MNKSVICAALLWSGINIAPAVQPLTTLVSNLPPATEFNDDWMLGINLLQPFTTGGAASLTTLQIASYSGWSASDSPTISLLDSGRNLVASFVYSANSAGGVDYTYSAPSNALQAGTYFIQVEGGSGYLNLTRSPDQAGLPG
jgi:hypothetical protein